MFTLPGYGSGVKKREVKRGGRSVFVKPGGGMEGSSVVARKGSSSGHERKVEAARMAWYGSTLVEEEGVDCCGGR
jgi:hypothetical protein